MPDAPDDKLFARGQEAVHSALLLIEASRKLRAECAAHLAQSKKLMESLRTAWPQGEALRYSPVQVEASLPLPPFPANENRPSHIPPPHDPERRSIEHGAEDGGADPALDREYGAAAD